MMVKILFMDVDGTLTDGKIHICDNGELFKSFNVRDGYAIHDILPQYGIIPVVLTARESSITKARCKELGIEYVIQNCSNKKRKMIQTTEEILHITLNNDKKIQNVAYIGDDVPDLECIKMADVSGCPKDSIQEIKSAVDFISSCNGGEGAVREFVEWIISIDRQQKF